MIDITPVLLLNMEDSSLRDISPSKHPVTLNGDVALDTSVKKFGTGSAVFDGTGDYLSLADSEDWHLGSSYTIEAWVNFSSTGSDQAIIGQAQPANDRAFLLNYEGGALKYYISIVGSSWETPKFSYAWSPSINTWYHVAVTHDGNNYTLYVDGSIVATDTGTESIHNASAILTVGGYWSPVLQPFNGYIDELRIIKGTALYTGAFTPPARAHNVPTLCTWDEFRNRRVLHVNGDAVADLSPEAHSLNNNGVAIFTNDPPFGGGYFDLDGVADRIDIPYSAVFDPGSLDFTIEAFVRTTAVDGIILGKRKSNATSDEDWYFRVDTNKLKLLCIVGSTASSAVSSIDINDGEWHHVVGVRDGDTLRVFVDGKQEGTAAITGSVNARTNNIGIGAVWDGNTSSWDRHLDGNIAYVRMDTGVARYTANFKPKWRPYCS